MGGKNLGSLVAITVTINLLKKIFVRFEQRYYQLCGNKMPSRCNRGFYCRSYCLLNMFRAPLCPSSELKSIKQWLLPVVFRAVVFKLLVWCGAEGYVFGLQDAAATTV